jgi:hypothetical protein
MRRSTVSALLLFSLACGDDAPAASPNAPNGASPSAPSPTAPAGDEAAPSAERPAEQSAPGATAVEPTPELAPPVGAMSASDSYTCLLDRRRVRCFGEPPDPLPDGEHDLLVALSDSVCVATRGGDGVRCFGGDAEMLGYDAASERWTASCAGDPECEETRESEFLQARRREGLVLAVDGVVAIAGATTLVCALGAEGRVTCWDLMGETSRPLRRLTIEGAVDLALADGTACVRLADGTVQCWEEWGDPEERVRARAVRGVEGAVRMAVGADLACAWNEASEARCWGFDWAFDRELPERGSARVRGLDGVAAFAFSPTEPFGCGLRDGHVECVGDPRYGRLGRRGAPGDERSYGATEPGRPAVADPRRIVVGSSHACALDASDALHCWGSAEEGALGSTRKRSNFAPVTVPGVRAEALAVLGGRTCARTFEAWRCWGPVSSTDRRAEPWRAITGDFPRDSEPVSFAGASCARFGESVRCSSATYEGRLLLGGPPCRLTAEGALECKKREEWVRAPEDVTGLQWIASVGGDVLVGASGGVGAPGRLRRFRFSSVEGTFTEKEPIETVPDDAVDVFGVGSEVCVRRASGLVSCRGREAWRDLATPALVEVRAGSSHACGRSAEGEVWCWGSNHLGQLGRGGMVSSETPLRVTELGVARALAVGRQHTCALVEEGAVRCWGHAHDGELGVDPGTWVVTPVRLHAPSDG